MINNSPIVKQLHYTEQNYTSSIKIDICYLCLQPLADDQTPDHVIPNALFVSGSPKRPKLPVHHVCNNNKSKDDKWFQKELTIMCGLHPEALEKFSKFIDTANREKENIGIVGKQTKLSNYKLARTLLNNVRWGFDIVYEGSQLSRLHLDQKSIERMSNYMKQLCRGLYMRNMPSSRPKDIDMMGFQYQQARVQGVFDGYMQSINNLCQMSIETRFLQSWDDRVSYIGNSVPDNPNAGFIFVEFYNSLGYLARFKS